MAKPRQQTELFTSERLDLIRSMLARWEATINDAKRNIELTKAEGIYSFGSPSLRDGSDRMQTFFTELSNASKQIEIGSPNTATTKKRQRV